jgi:hypothetical protein
LSEFILSSSDRVDGGGSCWAGRCAVEVAVRRRSEFDVDVPLAQPL